ncbi:MAG: lipoyl synthase [Pelagibacterales bacterium]|nr:lipoyl synthase [Pelagibacterales bacterium]OUU61281.1 MAG: lipoyl synthase [Alphaproteobacteria bacterium TMED62]|tara:strand:+ start:3892 stop:4815 length:924 start_codon:yes stop_codon:yes gene_type:complete
MNNNKPYISKAHLNNSNTFKLKRPSWIRVKAPISNGYNDSRELIKKLKLNTVCQEAACPNIGECWQKKHVTIMILGKVCTRKCTFCNIATGTPNLVDHEEPSRLANAIAALKLNHVVITSVDRDDLDDGGAQHFYNCINELRNLDKKVTIEILVPDFQRKEKALNIIGNASPDVFNHNLETIPRLYKEIRKGANYEHSLSILKKIKSYNNKIWTKSGLMVGLGETLNEIYGVMEDMRKNYVDFITIGQYLQPSKRHQELKKYYTLKEFQNLENKAWELGFSMVSCSPLTRSSYHADADFARLKKLNA